MDTTAASAQDKTSDMNLAFDNLKRSAQHIKDDTIATASSIKEDMARKAGRRIHDMADAVGHSAADVAGMTSDKVRDKPLMAIGIAAGVGFALGLLFRR